MPTDKELEDAMKTVEKIGTLKKALENRTKEIVGETLRELLKSDEFIELIREVLKDMVQEEVRKQSPAPYQPYNPWKRITEPDDDSTSKPKPYIISWYSTVDSVVAKWVTHNKSE